MSRYYGTESPFENATIARLSAPVGTPYRYGFDIDRDDQEVVLRPELRESLQRRYPSLAASALDTAIERITRPEGPEFLHRNAHSHQGAHQGLFDGRIEFTKPVSHWARLTASSTPRRRPAMKAWHP